MRKEKTLLEVLVVVLVVVGVWGGARGLNRVIGKKKLDLYYKTNAFARVAPGYLKFIIVIGYLYHMCAPSNEMVVVFLSVIVTEGE